MSAENALNGTGGEVGVSATIQEKCIHCEYRDDIICEHGFFCKYDRPPTEKLGKVIRWIKKLGKVGEVK